MRCKDTNLLSIEQEEWARLSFLFYVFQHTIAFFFKKYFVILQKTINFMFGILI